MNIQITGHHVEVTAAIRDYVNGKLERVTRHFDHVIDINVILSIDKLKQKVEATVRVRGKDIFAESEDHNMYAAIDGLVDKLDRSVIRHKEKQQDHRGATPVPADDE
ncbi:MAG: ribosome-associated translation inhibitor RaiA [Burkholderiales bacterium]|jgi:putative sigma-54 modulation protein|nr:ribosome-associated translation inhibitor RaiA [Burkholderiales bacterium]